LPTVKPLPLTYAVAILRLVFEDEDTWRRVRDAALAPHALGDSPLVVIDDPDYAGLDVSLLAATAPEAYDEGQIIVFDKVSREHPDHPLLIIDYYAYIDEQDEEQFTPGSLRITPDQVHSVHANLSLANMDFEYYVAHADAEGIYRGST
jgi:hypothetical protein